MIRLLGTLGIGALAMYFCDPVSGAHRRARLRERLAQARRDAPPSGFVAEARSRADRRLGERRGTAALDVDPT